METNRRRALGKGLEELFGGEVLDFDTLEEKIVNETPKEEIKQININELRSNPYQPRKVFDQQSLEELASSIREHGVFQPIIVKRSIKGYEIVAGERRVKASLIAGRETVPAIIRDFNDQEMMEIALLENLQREDLNPIEEAMAYQSLMVAKGLNHEQLAQRIGKSRSYVTNMVGLMNLPQSVKDLVISATHARTLSKIKDPAKVEEMADRIINEGLTTATIEELTQDKSFEKRNKMERKETEENKTYKFIQELLCDKLGTKVRIRGSKIEINFQDLNDFNRIMDLLNIHE